MKSDHPVDRYPFNIPAVGALPSIEFGAVTIFVGDNGSGKSTIVEALAVAAGFNAEGGSPNLQFETMATHSDLAEHIGLTWTQRPSWGWFLRAETFYGMATHIAKDDDPKYGLAAMFPDLHGRSHGQSFIELIGSRFNGRGLYLLDEPESALSFQAQVALISTIVEGVERGSQFIIATHSPLLMAVPGATIFELDADGAHSQKYADLTIVGLWRRFLADPSVFL